MPKYLRLLLLALALFLGMWFVSHRDRHTARPDADRSISKGTRETSKQFGSILSGSDRRKLSDRERLLAISDPYKFNSGLVIYLLSQDESTFTPLQEKVHTCHRIFLQIENGGVSGLLYNTDHRSQWCAQVANYCRELQAEKSADFFQAFAAIFAETEAQDLSNVKTWGDYLTEANQHGPLEEWMNQYDPYEDLWAPLIDFAFEHRESLLPIPSSEADRGAVPQTPLDVGSQSVPLQ